MRRTVFSLAEAAEIVGCTTDDLLSRGASGELRICTRVPPNMAVFSTIKTPSYIGVPDVYRKIHASKRIPVLPVPNIQLLVLSAKGCNLVMHQGETFEENFPAGVSISVENGLLIVEPPSLGTNEILDSRPFRILVCCDKETSAGRQFNVEREPSCLQVTTESMRILAMDIAPSQGVVIANPIFDIGFIPWEVMPRALVRLHEVAMIHWDCSQPQWYPPEPQNVKRSLREVEEYKVKMADAGEFFLRRSFENWNQKIYEQYKSEGRLNPFDVLVTIASAWRNDAQLEEKKYQDKNIASKFWTSSGFPDYLFTYAWRIATPSHARKTGRPSAH